MEYKNYVDEYIKWLKDKITYTSIGDYVEVNTPFLDNSNDYIQFYVKIEDNQIYFTDDGQTINNLIAQGLNLSTSRRKQISDLLLQYGVKLVGTELVTTSPKKDFARRKHMFIQSMIKLNDLYLMIHSKNSSNFIEEINQFFREKEIYCMADIKVTGKTGFDHNYDFVMQRTRNNPERFCIAMNSPNKATTSTAIFAWTDTSATRQSDSQFIVFLNDTNKINNNVIRALDSYNSTPLLWSNRNSKDSIKLLSA